MMVVFGSGCLCCYTLNIISSWQHVSPYRCRYNVNIRERDNHMSHNIKLSDNRSSFLSRTSATHKIKVSRSAPPAPMRWRRIFDPCSSLGSSVWNADHLVSARRSKGLLLNSSCPACAHFASFSHKNWQEWRLADHAANNGAVERNRRTNLEARRETAGGIYGPPSWLFKRVCFD